MAEPKRSPTESREPELKIGEIVLIITPGMVVGDWLCRKAGLLLAALRRAF